MKTHAKTRTLLIVLGALVVVGVLCLGAAAGGVLAYFASQARPVQAFGPVQVLQPRQGAAEAGVLVAEVAESGPAAEAGVARGDIILEVNGSPVEQPVDLTQAIRGLNLGDPVELRVQHGDDQRTLTAALGERDGRPYLGLTPCGFPHSEEVFFQGNILQGARIITVTPGSPAQEAGLKEGDSILSVDGDEVGAENSLNALIAAYQPGDRVTLEISRPGEEPHEVQVELGEHPDQPGKAYLGVEFAPALPDGMPFKRLPFEGKPFEIPKLPEGVTKAAVIGEVVSGSPADEAGLQAKDFITGVDGEPLENPEALAAAIQSHQPGEEITLTVFHPGDAEVKEVEVTLGEDPQEDGKAYLGISALGFIHIQRDENGAPVPNLDLPFNFQVPDFLDRIRERLSPGETL
jgi:S1-C subfamily serine protease